MPTEVFAEQAIPCHAKQSIANGQHHAGLPSCRAGRKPAKSGASCHATPGRIVPQPAVIQLDFTHDAIWGQTIQGAVAGASPPSFHFVFGAFLRPHSSLALCGIANSTGFVSHLEAHQARGMAVTGDTVPIKTPGGTEHVQPGNAVPIETPSGTEHVEEDVGDVAKDAVPIETPFCSNHVQP